MNSIDLQSSTNQLTELESKRVFLRKKVLPSLVILLILNAIIISGLLVTSNYSAFISRNVTPLILFFFIICVTLLFFLIFQGLQMRYLQYQSKHILVPKSLSHIPFMSNIQFLQPYHYYPHLCLHIKDVLTRKIPKSPSSDSASLQTIQSFFKKHRGFKLNKINDHIQFDYKHCSVELIDASLTYTEGSGKDRRSYTEYYLILKTVFPDTVEGKTVVSRIDNWKFRLSEKISTESIELNQLFDIKATNQVSARMHLQPNFMANILDLYQDHQYENIIYFFQDATLTVIMKEPRAAFEPNITISLLSPDQLTGIQHDVQKCLQIFDTMWLDIRAHKQQN